MAEVTETGAIKQVDPFYSDRPHLDFQFLRRAGLQHLGELSGQIWSDHNTHDPGVTILEELCYVLIDLGYRATLPVEDLLAGAPGASVPAGAFAPDDNFFTPLQILSCNPTTIADYRKLLLEVDGVRNAWLVPSKSDDPPLYLEEGTGGESRTTKTLVCGPPPANAHPIQLNGLYSVLIEKEPSANDDEIFGSVQKLLSAHRNLCEDFQDVVVLCPFEVGICADLEIDKTVEAPVVYEAVLNSIQSYIAPRIHYYTLKQLLDKGQASSSFSVDDLRNPASFAGKVKAFADPVSAFLRDRLPATTRQALNAWSDANNLTAELRDALIAGLNDLINGASIWDEARFTSVQIRAETRELLQSNPTGPQLVGLNRLLLEDTYPLELSRTRSKAIEDIFAGRAFLDKSVGFIDLDELKNLPLRKELYASDLYRSIKEIDGVVAIRDLLFQTDGTVSRGEGNIQRLRIPDRYVASFSLERTCIQLRVGQSVLHFDKSKIHKRLTVSGKADLERKDLDIQIPGGRFDPERSAYDSVQNDFPRVYGLGEGGLPGDATVSRRVQTHQLQGYLLFYDQLLANYLAQMSNFRSLFSLRQESTRSLSEQHTYFNHGLEGVPGLKQLLQLNAGGDLNDGSLLAASVNDDETLRRTLETLNPRKELRIEGSCGPEEGALPHLAYGTDTLREVSLRQSMRELAQGDYGIEIYEDKGGHFFILRFTQVSTWLFVGYLRYSGPADAREAANYAAFLATRPNYYRKTTQQNGEGAIDYRFDLVSKLTADAIYLQYLVENEELYWERREAFLDHLLARFANQFTDYALLQYQTAETLQQVRGHAIEDKSRFLSHFDELSRNRGRASDYMEPSWGTENVSGYEMRVSGLAGILAWTRRRLCRFEVVESYQQSGGGGEAASGLKWIYRLIDKDHPIAKDCYDPKEDVQKDLKRVCGFVPLRLECEQQVLRVICPTRDPNKFHYAICLPDDDGKEFTFLISYLGYESREKACRAGEANWLQLIELATDSGHYGEAKQIAPEEAYGESSGVCAETEPYLAVMANEFREQFGAGAVEKAVTLAKRYPIRITYKRDADGTLTYKKDASGKLTKEIKGYHFQGYDLALDKCIWQSTKVYATPQETLEAYRVFVVVLHNRDSCRVVCEEGHYRIHLVEILVESSEFDTEDKAWGEPQTIAEDACGRLVCRHQGVRLFADTATAESAFISKHEDGCYQFIVVGTDYRVARHTCSYNTTKERDEALEKIHNWASGITCRSYEKTWNGRVLRCEIGVGYYLESIDPEESIDPDRRGPKFDIEGSEVEQIVDRWLYLALGKVNYREVGNEWHLIDPFEGGVSIAKVKRETGSGEFSIAGFQQLVREYPVFKKGDRYCFRLFYPENGGVLDERLEICGCKEPAKNGQEARSFCGKPYLFESVQCYPCRAAAEEAFRVFCDLVKDRSNYDYESGCVIGPYSFTIIDPAKVLAKHPHCHPNAAGATRAIERARACMKDEGMHLVEHILLRPQACRQNTGCECLLPVCPDFACELTWQDDLDEDDPCSATKNPPLQCIPGADPYSFWATLVLPGWYPRFQRKDKRQFFKEMLYREAPAMVGLNILWLSPKQMCEFDEAFRSWLDWFRDPELLCQDRDKALCNLVDCIKRLRNDAPCPVIETVSAECDCLPKADDKPYRCIEQVDQLFWLECEPEEQPTDQENEGIAQPEIPAAAGAETAAAPAAMGESVTVDPSAIRQTIAKREGIYRKNIRAVPGEQIRATKGYQQAEFFVNNPPSIDAFGKLAIQILEKDMGRRRTHGSFNSILQNATWYLLDNLVQTNPHEVPDDIRAALPVLLAAMKSKGVDTSRMAKDWKSKSLERVLHAAAIQEYLRLFKET